MVQAPTSKLDDAAFTRVRIILMNGLESEANRFSHACARMNRELQLPLARVRRVEQHQQTLVNWLLPADTAQVASLGLWQVLTDPRTSVPQCLQALLTAELTDNDGWQLLINLAGELGHAEMAAEFQTALASEETHLASVRGWLEEHVLTQAQA